MDISTLAERYVEDWAALNPIGAGALGIKGSDDRFDDMSPDGFAARAGLDRRTIAALTATEAAGEAEQVAKDSMLERLGLAVEQYDAGHATSLVSVVASGAHAIRMIFDLMPTEGEAAVANIAARLHAAPTALSQYQRSLREAAAAGHVSARDQMLAVADLCDEWTGLFPALAGRLTAEGALRTGLDHGASATSAAFGEFATFLRTELAPRGAAKQAVGLERYTLASREFLGARVDLLETYAWGFEELHRLETEMRATATRIGGPGATIDEALTRLDEDPARRIHGKEAFRDWMQDLADRAIAELDGVHFDIPEQLRTLEARIAPTSDGIIYYTGPSEDFTRPGRMWWSVAKGDDSFSTWQQTSAVYHEGVPGHHLQIGHNRVLGDRLNRWQRQLSVVAGHSEGWALYAERLMDDLGYLEDPGDRMGMLDLQRLRTVRVILDIGMHLELVIPARNPFDFHPGETWNPDLGWEFLRAHNRMPDGFLGFELKRYLGYPGQAPSYKIGERIWLQARADAQRRQGAAFDLKTFHRSALDLGPLGLEPLQRALGQL